MAYIYYDEFKLVDEQTIISLQQPVVKEFTSIDLNGIGLFNEDYEIIDPITIKLLIDIYDGDTLKIECNLIKVDYNVVGDYNALIEKYDYSKKTLLKNNTISVILSVNNINFTSKFRTRFDFKYSNNSIIKQDLFSIFDFIDEQRLSEVLYRNSLELNELVLELEEYENIAEEPNFLVRQWVRYKTDVDLINSIYIEMSSNLGSESKQFGTTNVDKTIGKPELDKMLELYTKRLKGIQDLILGDSLNVVQSFRRASLATTTIYEPLVNRNIF